MTHDCNYLDNDRVGMSSSFPGRERDSPHVGIPTIHTLRDGVSMESGSSSSEGVLSFNNGEYFISLIGSHEVFYKKLNRVIGFLIGFIRCSNPLTCMINTTPHSSSNTSVKRVVQTRITLNPMEAI